jgi:hypothetical protein
MARRGRIVNLFATFRPEREFAQAAKSLVVLALTDRSPGARQAAVRSVGYNQWEDLLPQVVDLFEDDNEGVRSSTANVLGQFGPAARRFLPVCECSFKRVERPGSRQSANSD